MLRDITIGQHFPGNSLVHRFDPRLKLVLTILYIVLLFAASNPLGLALSLVFLAAMYAVAKIPFRLILKSLKPIFPIIVFTAVLNLFFVSGEGDPAFSLDDLSPQVIVTAVHIRDFFMELLHRLDAVCLQKAE